MCVRPILWILVSISIQEVFLLENQDEYEDEIYEDSPLSCSTAESIKGGHVTYSQGGQQGSVMTYHCGPGQYPSPVSQRLCGDNGEWSTMRLASGRRVSRATCKNLLCPAQLQLDHGDFWPRDQWLPVGATQSFSCQEGFTLYGSAERNCSLSGEWTGTTPVCDNHANDCNDPGIPPGAQRSASQFDTGEKVIYKCQTGMDLLGSAERVCLENREWSGSAPRCQAPHTFDSPSHVAAAMTGSLSGLMDVLSPESMKKDTKRSFGRTFRVAEGSRMNIYILLDTSGSISKKDFDASRHATSALIRKLDSYEVQLKFHVLSFATEVKDIVNITDTEISTSPEDVIWHLMDFNYKSHGRKTGTNLYAALHHVSEMINFFKQFSAKNYYNETQNIIIIQTDGFANTGPKPLIALSRIRHLLGYQAISDDHTDETMLDVYVFGIGGHVNKDQLNSLASKKRGEEHVFILKDPETLGEMFNSIISDKSVTMCGVAQEDISKELEEAKMVVYNKPWHVTITTNMHCFGSIVSQNWLLTAAHCFAKASTDQIPQNVLINHGADTVVPKAVFIHPNYSTTALKHRNVSEFYDYDVALVQVNQSIPLSWKARPICLPCTVPASRAMKKFNSTCQQHRKELLPHEETVGFFIHKDSKRKETHIHTQGQRKACIEKAMQTLTEPTDVTVDEYVPDTFLCSGGSHMDKLSCKGDSGGSLFLQKRKRYFQVGVVSWGTLNVCDRKPSAEERSQARDFHIDLFKIMPWLKQHLGDDIQFLPDVK